MSLSSVGIFTVRLRNLITRLIIPIQRPALDLGPSRQKLPPKRQLDILLHVRRDLQRPEVRGVVLRPDIVVRQDAGRVEVVHEAGVFVVVVDAQDFVEETVALLVGSAGLVEAGPEGLWVIISMEW